MLINATLNRVEKHVIPKGLETGQSGSSKSLSKSSATTVASSDNKLNNCIQVVELWKAVGPIIKLMHEINIE